MAAADVTVGGSGSIGVVYKEANVAPKNETNLLSRLNLDFTAVTQSDAGIEFGGFARYRYNQEDAAIMSGDVSGGRLHAAMGPVTLQVGNIADAIDALPGRIAGTAAIPTLNGSVAINPIVGFASQTGGAVNGANLQYSMAGLKVFLSATDSDNEKVAGHVAYTMSGWTVAAGALDAEDGHDITALAVTGDLGFATVGGAFARNENAGPADDDADKVRFHANIPFGATFTYSLGSG